PPRLRRLSPTAERPRPRRSQRRARSSRTTKRSPPSWATPAPSLCPTAGPAPPGSSPSPRAPCSRGEGGGLVLLRTRRELGRAHDLREHVLEGQVAARGIGRGRRDAETVFGADAEDVRSQLRRQALRHLGRRRQLLRELSRARELRVAEIEDLARSVDG